VQAASLVRSIDALSNIFWLCFLGFFLSVFFAGLSQLEGNAYTDFIFLGEYQVPKSILPLASLSFAVFAFWMVSNRLNMLAYVLGSSTLSGVVMRDIFSLNPPVLHIFDRSNSNPWSMFTGISVFIFIWAVFFGNAVALIWSGAVEQGASVAEFDPLLLGTYAIVIVLVIVFGTRAVVPPLRAILDTLHGEDFRIGWQRYVMALVVMLATIVINQSEQFFSNFDNEDNDLIGPAFANAIDGETLFIRGIEVSLFGIDAVEHDQICQDKGGKDYACGQRATQALQQLVQSEPVICLPIVSITDRRVLAICEVTSDAQPPPMDSNEFLEGYRPDSLSRLMIVEGHAIGIGLGQEIFREEEIQAQTLRRGIWQGSFQPPSLWRSSRTNK
jgi:endonuclease YncB( thermonuclease family)